jgi:hypothetical protein
MFYLTKKTTLSMKRILDFIPAGCFSILAMLAFVACKKNNLTTTSLVSLTVTNVVINGPAIRVGSNLNQVANNNSLQLGLIAGDNDLYVWPVGDSANPYYTSSKFFADENSIYSLFIAGRSPNISGIIIKDNIPYHTDSTCGVRIINLVPNSTPLNITLSSSPTTNEVSGLAYLQYTDFKIYPAKAANASYTFQVRKSTDNTVLVSYLLNTPRFTNVTLVIRGLPIGTPVKENMELTPGML